jgi:N-acetylmuramoyl-L-alanine amidase
VVIDFARDALPTQATQLAKLTPPEPTASPQPNAGGGFSLSRQLGLGVARVVIDPGHGGHDPGAMNNGLSEAELVLDVGMRLEKLLLNQPGVEVVMTRRTNVFVPLEERTALANRERADLFLSIHANASEDDRVRGIETYFLNFAPNPAAEVVAARENAASAQTMRQLPDIVKAIALNNKIDESRDFASLIQSSMMDRLKRSNKSAKDLGVKQAPFMVLIGATMPSILAEVSFITNRQEAALLRSSAYRQQIAAALFNGVMRYQKSLKAAAQTFASQ